MGLTLTDIPRKSVLSHPVRSILLVLLVAAQAACLLGGALVSSSLVRDLSVAEGRLGADLLVYPESLVDHAFLEDAVMQGSPVEGFAARDELTPIEANELVERMSYQLDLRCETPAGKGFWVVVFDPSTDFVLAPWLTDGKGHGPSAGEVAVGCDIDSEDGIVEVFGRTWPVGTRLPRTGTDLDDAVFFVADDASAVMEDAASWGLSECEGVDPASVYSVAQVDAVDGVDLTRLRTWVNLEVDNAAAVRSDSALADMADVTATQAMFTVCVALAAWIALLASLAVAQSIMTRERQREFFVWRVSGASQRMVANMHMRETLMLYLAGAAIGVFLALVIVSLSMPQVMLGLPFVAVAGVMVVAASLFVGWMSSRLALRKSMAGLDAQMLVAR